MAIAGELVVTVSVDTRTLHAQLQAIEQAIERQIAKTAQFSQDMTFPLVVSTAAVASTPVSRRALLGFGWLRGHDGR